MEQQQSLTLEQQFSIANIKSKAAKMSKEQLESFLVEVYTLMLSKDNAYKNLIKHNWGITSEM